MPLVDTNWFLQSDLQGVIHELPGREFEKQERQVHGVFTEDAIERIDSGAVFYSQRPRELFWIGLMVK